MAKIIDKYDTIWRCVDIFNDLCVDLDQVLYLIHIMRLPCILISFLAIPPMYWSNLAGSR